MDRLARWEPTRATIDAFRFDGELVRTEPLPGGHIHRNFLVTCRGGRYVLQRLNDIVFPDIDLVLRNVERVVTHLGASRCRAPMLVETHSGALSLRVEDGSAWRAFHFLEGTVGRDTISGPGDAYESGRCFADYMVTLATLPGPPLTRTIEGFHDLHRRRATLEAVAGTDPVGRRSDVLRELSRAMSLSQQVVDGLAAREGRQRVRTVHNDAKLRNLRFDAFTGEAVCVIDFDTTMPGSVRHDVGELVRTATTHAREDAPAETSVDFDLELLEALAAGYFAGCPDLEVSEIDTMALAGPEMAVENGLRFLTDHIAGDRYFAVDRHGQNLDRCRTQLRLAELMLATQAEIDACFARAAWHAAPTGESVTGRAKGSP